MTKPIDEQEKIVARLAATLSLLRQEQKLSLRELSEKTDVNHSELFRLENGTTKNPTIFQIRKLAIYYGMTVDELMNFDAKTCPTCGGRGWVKV